MESISINSWIIFLGGIVVGIIILYLVSIFFGKVFGENLTEKELKELLETARKEDYTENQISALARLYNLYHYSMMVGRERYYLDKSCSEEIEEFNQLIEKEGKKEGQILPLFQIMIEQMHLKLKENEYYELATLFAKKYNL